MVSIKTALRDKSQETSAYTVSPPHFDFSPPACTHQSGSAVPEGLVDRRSSSGLSERNLHTARALVDGAIQPTPVRGRSLCDAKASGATLELLDGTDCLPTSLRTGIGLFTAAALGCGTVGSKIKRLGLFLASAWGHWQGIGFNTFGFGHIIVTILPRPFFATFLTPKKTVFCNFVTFLPTLLIPKKMMTWLIVDLV